MDAADDDRDEGGGRRRSGDQDWAEGGVGRLDDVDMRRRCQLGLGPVRMPALITYYEMGKLYFCILNRLDIQVYL